MLKFLRSSLQYKILAWSFAPAALVLTLAALVAYLAAQNILQQLVLERDKAVVYIQAEQLRSDYEIYAGYLNTLARTADLYGGDSARQQSAISRARSRLVVFDAGVILLDKDGRVVASEPAQPDLLGQWWNDRPYYRNYALARTGEVSAAAYFGAMRTDGPQPGENTVSISVPVLGEQGEFRGVLSGYFLISPQSTNVLYGSLLKYKLGERGAVLLLDRTGNVLYHSETEHIGQNFAYRPYFERLFSLRGLGGAERNLDEDGESVVSGYAPLRGSEWGLVIEESWEALNAPYRSYQITLGVLLLLGVLLPALFAWRGARRMMQPLQDLTAASQSLAQGDFERQITATTGDEIQTLAENFNQMAQKLQESYSHLEEKVAARTAELQQASEAAQSASRAKSAFLANMSHELRTPLSAILGFSQLMAHDDNLNEEQRENLNTILRSGEHLLQLINDVLEMSKIEAGRIVLRSEAFNLHRLLVVIESMFRLRAAQKDLQYTLEPFDNLPIYIRSDEGKLRQVLINLIGNALKFTNSGGVTLRAYIHPTIEPPPTQVCVAFEVQDTGPGIAPVEQERLFLPFSQTSSGQQSQEGTGLGLAISKQHVELMGGKIGLSSQPGHGSTFTFYIMAEMASAEEVQEETLVIGKNKSIRHLAADQVSPRILVTEDKTNNRQVLVRMLQRVGFDVREAADGEEALQIWQVWQPDLIWMDLRMPVLDGLEATRCIRQHEKALSESGQAAKRVIIIALSASTFDTEINLARAAGLDDFVRKPFRERLIFEKLAQHLGVRYILEDEPVASQSGKRPAGSASNEADVVWQAEEQSSLAAAWLRSQLAGQPPAWQRQCYQAVTQADARQLSQLLQTIEASNPVAADRVRQLAQNFRFDLLMEVFAAQQE